MPNEVVEIKDEELKRLIEEKKHAKRRIEFGVLGMMVFGFAAAMWRRTANINGTQLMICLNSENI
jgi:hypothetical protein